MTFELVCPTCPGTFPAPVDPQTGLPTLRPDLLTRVQTSSGEQFIPMCPQCADNIMKGTAPQVSTV